MSIEFHHEDKKNRFVSNIWIIKKKEVYKIFEEQVKGINKKIIDLIEQHQKIRFNLVSNKNVIYILTPCNDTDYTLQIKCYTPELVSELPGHVHSVLTNKKPDIMVEI